MLKNLFLPKVLGNYSGDCYTRYCNISTNRIDALVMALSEMIDGLPR